MFSLRDCDVHLISYFFISRTTTREREREREKKTHLPVVRVIIHLFPGGWIKDFPPHNETYVERKTHSFNSYCLHCLVLPDRIIYRIYIYIYFGRSAQSVFISGTCSTNSFCGVLCIRDLSRHATIHACQTLRDNNNATFFSFITVELSFSQLIAFSM